MDVFGGPELWLAQHESHLAHRSGSGLLCFACVAVGFMSAGLGGSFWDKDTQVYLCWVIRVSNLSVSPVWSGGKDKDARRLPDLYCVLSL